MEDLLARVPWPVETDRLRIRRARDADIEATWQYRRLPEVGEYIGWWTTSFEEYRDRLLDDDRRRMMLTIEKKDGTVIGDVMVKLAAAWAQHEAAGATAITQAELGWTLDPAAGGRGLATEAVRAVIAMCFTELGLRRVHAGCFAANEPSWRLMERVGMRREQFSRASGLHRSGEWMDGMEYALLAEEWRAAHDGHPQPTMRAS